MEIVFQRGTCWAPYSKVSTTSLVLGRGGKMYSFWAMYSFRMSFWVVPDSLSQGMPLFSAFTRYMAQIMAAGLLMVIDVVTSSRGMPSKRISMSASDETATPHVPNSPSAWGSSVSYPYSVGMSYATERPALPLASRYLK